MCRVARSICSRSRSDNWRGAKVPTNGLHASHYDDGNPAQQGHYRNGKRVGLWKGTRVIYTCTECHNAHTPQIAREEAVPPPAVRENLAGFTQPPAPHPRMWEWLTPTVESNR